MTPDKKKKLFIIVGPTSSGKTSTAIKLCKKFNGEIISADSRQLCKFMDIGTGKLPIKSNAKVKKNDNCWVVDGVNVWGYDLVTPDKFFSGYDFALFSLKKSFELMEGGKNVFLVGGTGLYIDLFTGDIRPSGASPNEKFRSLLEDLPLEKLQTMLKTVSLEAYEEIDLNNKVRLIRAIEKKMSSKTSNTPLPYLEDVEFVYIGLTGDRKLLYERSDKWVDFIWKNGLIDEVKELISMGYERSSKMKGLIYKTVVGFINNKIAEEHTIERMKFDIHAYIRRQQTWFKRNKNITWVDISKDDFEEIIYNIVKGGL